ncbi:MAG: hypothetical protein A6F70_02485 [Cycloclasticus sp. symbiont of Bathymodiolus heckerae]|nr:MAG: hypothetical protein A6F70_02485 [Cycloclasticus sp. symbiont of Bathymodiolus heckerae]
MKQKDYLNPLNFGALALFLASATAYFFLYNTEVYDNSRFIGSFNQPIAEAQQEPKKLAALKALQGKGLEWAHYQFVDAIQDQDAEVVGLYVDAGMVLKDRSAIMTRLIEAPESWITLVERLGWDNETRLSGLFPVPRHLDALDDPFNEIKERYIVPHDMAFKNHYLEFKKIHDKWQHEKELELANVEVMCEQNTRCKIKNTPGILVEYEKKKPIAPTKDLILWLHPNITLMSAAILLKRPGVVDYLEQKGVTSRANEMVMSDQVVVIFEVSPTGDISYPEGITVKNLKLEERQTGQQTGSHF